MHKFQSLHHSTKFLTKQGCTNALTNHVLESSSFHKYKAFSFINLKSSHGIFYKNTFGVARRNFSFKFEDSQQDHKRASLASDDGSDNIDFREITDRMKYLEAQYEPKVNFEILDEQPIIMRFDGFHFKSFTSNGDIFEKPFDANIHWAMMLAVRDFCVKGVNLAPTLIYICSDEITLLFSSKTEKGVSHPSHYNGRIQKLISISTSFMTEGFNYYLRKLLSNNYESFEKRIEYDSKNLKSHSKKILTPSDLNLRRETRQKLIDGNIAGHFDCRVYQVPSVSHAAEYILWRQHDCVRNSKTILGSKYFEQPKMDNLSAAEVVEMVEQKSGVRWTDFPNEYKYGTFIKKIKHFKSGFNPITKTNTTVVRTSPFNQCIKLMHCSPEFITNLVTQPQWSHNVLACNPMHEPEKVVLNYPTGVSFTFGVQPYSFGVGNQAPVLHKDHLNSPFNEHVMKFSCTTLAALSEMDHV